MKQAAPVGGTLAISLYANHPGRVPDHACSRPRWRRPISCGEPGRRGAMEPASSWPCRATRAAALTRLS